MDKFIILLKILKSFFQAMIFGVPLVGGTIGFLMLVGVVSIA